jgi:uncharacterized protein
MQRVAVVGSGIAGLVAPRELAKFAHVTLFEADAHFGGHASTVDVRVDGLRHPVDTGFLVFNHHTYPGLTRLFSELRIDTAASDMSLSVQRRDTGLEWCGSSLNTVFAQRINLLRPRFWAMLSELVRFNRLATLAVLRATADETGPTLATAGPVDALAAAPPGRLVTTTPRPSGEAPANAANPCAENR